MRHAAGAALDPAQSRTGMDNLSSQTTRACRCWILAASGSNAAHTARTKGLPSVVTATTVPSRPVSYTHLRAHET